MIGARPDRVGADLAALPDHLERVRRAHRRGCARRRRAERGRPPDRTEHPVLASLADVRPLLDGRPALTLADRHAADWHCELPAGHLPADWLPAHQPPL